MSKAKDLDIEIEGIDGLELDLTDLEEEDFVDSDLLEFKSDDKYSVSADPVDGVGGPVKKRRGDKSIKTLSADVTTSKTTLPRTKAGVVGAMMKHMESMNAEEITSVLEAMEGANNSDEESVNFEEDVNAIFAGHTLDEDLKDKAKTIFEAAVSSRVSTQVKIFAEQAEIDFTKQMETIREELSEKLDSYLDYVVEQWMEANAIAVDSGIKTDMAESFMQGIKNLFNEHYVNIPEEGVDVIEELTVQVDDLTDQLNETLTKNIELSDAIKEYKLDQLFSEASSELTDSQSAKLLTLSEGVEFVDEEDYLKKLMLLKDRYFSIKEGAVGIDGDDDEPLIFDEEVKYTTPNMAAYAASITRTAKNL